MKMRNLRKLPENQKLVQEMNQGEDSLAVAAISTESSRVRKTARGRATLDNILEVATRIAGQEGLEGLTIGRLAKEAGMSKSGLFAHFQSRDTLQLRVLESAADNFISRVLKPAFHEPRGLPRVRAVFENWIRFLNDKSIAGGSIFVSAAFEFDDRPGRIRDYIQKVQMDLIDSLKRAAEISIEEGHFSSQLDTGHFAWTFYAFVLGYHHSFRMLEDPQAEAHARAALEGLLNTAQEGMKFGFSVNAKKAKA